MAPPLHRCVEFREEQCHHALPDTFLHVVSTAAGESHPAASTVAAPANVRAAGESFAAEAAEVPAVFAVEVEAADLVRCPLSPIHVYGFHHPVDLVVSSSSRNNPLSRALLSLGTLKRQQSLDTKLKQQSITSVS